MNGLGDLVLVLVGFGLGAIAAGAAVLFFWRRAVRRVQESRVADWCAQARHGELLADRLALYQAEAAHWHRLYVAAALVQRAVVEHRHVLPEDPGESWRKSE